MTKGYRKIKRALLSVSDKDGIVAFAKQLEAYGIEIISTGGTLSTLLDAGINAHSVSSVTGFPEILGGRVKTLHPKIHGGLLGIADNPGHVEEMKEHDIEPIDLLGVNLYPFERTAAKNGAALAEVTEQIDVGGPAMIRAAAKNFESKTVVTEPASYGKLLEELKAHGGSVTRPTRLMFARDAFLHTARYDTAIFEYLTAVSGTNRPLKLPDVFSVIYKKEAALRYGENPHQEGALYGGSGGGSGGGFAAYFDKLHGKELSYNNITDIQAAAELLEEFEDPTVVIIKHTNPCGVGSGKTLKEAYEKALATDPKSAFGGVVAANRAVPFDVAALIDKLFTELIIAPEFEADALEFLKRKKDRRLILQRLNLRSRPGLSVRSVAGALLVQSPDAVEGSPKEPKVVTKRAPNTDERKAMEFAWRVVKHVKSNAMVYARPDRTIGIGAGQMSRFDSSMIAVIKAKSAGLNVAGTAVASDAFFPFADGLLEAVKAGATAVIQPGGSMRDDEVIRAADEHGIAMVFTGMRHFKH